MAISFQVAIDQCVNNIIRNTQTVKLANLRAFQPYLESVEDMGYIAVRIAVQD